jgi:hypothetical protein
MTRITIALFTFVAFALAGSPVAARASDSPTVTDLIDAHWGGGFHPGGMNGRVTALQVIGNDLYIGGEFTAVGAVPAQFVARYDGSTWHRLGHGTDGPVTALGTFDGDLVAGGMFLHAGLAEAISVARWDGGRWRSMGDGFDGCPLAFTEEDGRLLAGGSFLTSGVPDRCTWTTVDGNVVSWSCTFTDKHELPFAAEWDRASWETAGPAWDHPGALASMPRGFVQYGGDLVAFGDFTSAEHLGEVADHCGLARWTASGWWIFGPPQITAGPRRPRIRAALAAGDSLILGGLALTGGSGPADHVAVWDGSGLHPLGEGFDKAVLSLTLYQGRIVAAGDFTRSGSTPLNRVAWWDGTSWRPFGDGLDGLVRTLAVYDGMLVAGGDFEGSGGRTMRYLAAWRDTSWIPLYHNPGGGLDRLVLAIVDYQGRPTVGTVWDEVRGDHVYMRDGDSWIRPGSDIPVTDPSGKPRAWHPGHGTFADARLWDQMTLTVHRGNLVYSDGRQLGIWDGASWTHAVPNVGLRDNSGVVRTYSAHIRCVAPYGDSLLIGGVFTAAGGVPGGDVAVWDGTNTHPLGTGIYTTQPPPVGLSPDLVAGVHALGSFRGDVVAGGLFDRTADEVVRNIAVYDGAAWHGLGTGTDDAVTVMATYHDQLYAGGFFTEAGGGLASHLARWDGSDWHPVQGGTDGPVFSMTVYHDRLIVGGVFQVAGGYPARNVAAFDGTRWSPLGSGVDGMVTGLTVIGDDLYLGGDFWEAGGKGADHVARWTDGPAEPTLSDLRAERVPGGARIRGSVDYLPADHRDFRLWRQSYGALRTLVTAEPVAGTVLDVTDPDAPAAAATYWFEERTTGGGSTMLGPVSLAPPSGLALTLAQNRPNPFAGSTRIAYRVPVEGTVDLAVFDVAGRRVAVLLHDRVPPGAYEASWDGRDDRGQLAASGIYFYRLRTPAGTLTRKLVKTE